MAKLNWNKCKKSGVSYGPKRQLALKLKRKSEITATEKQRRFMGELGIQFPENVTKFQAMKLISWTLDKKRELEWSTSQAMALAMDRDGT